MRHLGEIQIGQVLGQTIFYSAFAFKLLENICLECRETTFRRLSLFSLPMFHIVLDSYRHLCPHMTFVYGSFPFSMFSLHHYPNP